MSIQVKIITLLVSIIGSAIGIYFFGEHRYEQGEATATLRDNQVIADMKIKAARILGLETLKTKAVEDVLAAALHERELKDADNHKTIEVLSTYIRSIVGDSGRLRDPNAAGCGSSGGSTAGQTFSNASSGPANGAESGGLLSAELSGLLTRLTREADDVNEAYISCRADAFQVRASDTPSAGDAPAAAVKLP
jgi:hypothetical protein